jgi:RNA polymerase-binding transcription factor DksA
MKGKELQRVKVALLNKLDTALQQCYHQGLHEVMTDLRIRYTNVKPDSTPDEIFSLFLQTGILKTVSAEPIVQMRESLERLNKGTFGTCTVCGSEIPVKRLEKDPTAPWCDSCDKEAQKLIRRPEW